MCCLFGILDYGHTLSQRQREQMLSILAAACEARGTGCHRHRLQRCPGAADLQASPSRSEDEDSHSARRKCRDGSHSHDDSGNAQFNQNNHPFLGHVDGNSFALAHNGVLWNDKELRMEENLPLTSVETDSYVAVQLLEQQKALDFDSLKSMAEKVEGSFVFTVLDKDNSIWFVVGDNPLCVMFYDGFLIYASTQEILCKTLKKLRLKAPIDILEPQEGEIMKINRNGRITTGTFTPHTTFEHWWRKYPFYRSYYENTPTSYDDLFSVAKSFGVTADEVQALLDYGCSEEEIEEMLYDPELFHEMTGELLYAY